MDTIKKLGPYSHWLVRLNLAAIFIYHGVTKFPMAEMMAQGMGMPLGMIYMLAMMEIAGGMLVLYGGFGSDIATRAGAFLIMGVMLGAIGMIHWPQWSFMATETNKMGGMEFQLLTALISFSLLTRGNSFNGRVA